MNIWQIIAAIVLTAGSGILGRMGGSDKYNTKWRDIGVPVCCCLLIGILGGFHWTLIICCGLLFASMTTYFKKKGEPVRWYNWLICGAAYCIAILPYAIAKGLGWGFALRLMVLPTVIMAWCVLVGNAVVEEVGRYAILTASAILLFWKKKK